MARQSNRRAACGLVALILTASVAPAVAAAEAGAGVSRLPPPLDAEALSTMRGGFMTAGGLRFDFGVTVRSYVGESLALETRLRWTREGAVSETSAFPVEGVTDLSAALAQLAGAGVDLSGVSGLAGVAVVDGDGVSALVHGVGQGRLQNLVLNTADGRSLRQEMAITLSLPDLARIQSGATLDGFRAGLIGDLRQSQLGALGR